MLIKQKKLSLILNSVADIVISRAGASSISELCLAEKASIFVPSPNVSEDHQTKNAMALVNNHAALLVKDVESNEKLIPELMDLIKDENKIDSLKKNIAKIAYKDSANIIADEVMKLIKK